MSASEGDSQRNTPRVAGGGAVRGGKTDRSLWKPEDDAIILQNVAKHGHKWSHLALLLPGRSSHAIRNRYHRLGVRRRWLEHREHATRAAEAAAPAAGMPSAAGVPSATAVPSAAATPSVGWLPCTTTVTQQQCVVSGTDYVASPQQMLSASPSPYVFTTSQPPPVVSRHCSFVDYPCGTGALRAAYDAPTLSHDTSLNVTCHARRYTPPLMSAHTYHCGFLGMSQ